MDIAPEVTRDIFLLPLILRPSMTHKDFRLFLTSMSQPWIAILQREHGRRIKWKLPRFSFAWTMNGCYIPINNHYDMLKAHKMDSDIPFFLLFFSCYQFEMWKQRSCKHFATGLQRTSQCLCCRMASNWRQSRQRVYAPTSCAPSSQCLMIRLGQKVQNAFWLRAATVGSDEVSDWKLLVFACPLVQRENRHTYMLFFGVQGMYFPNNSRDCGIYTQWHNHTNIDPSGFRGRPLHSYCDLCAFPH